MASSGRSRADDKLALLLAQGKQAEECARECNIGLRTVYRRLATPEFRQKICEIRSEFLRQTVGRLSALGTKSVEKLDNLMDSDEERIKLGAVKATLDNLFKGVETANLADKLEELMQEIQRMKAHGDIVDQEQRGESESDDPRSSSSEDEDNEPESNTCSH